MQPCKAPWNGSKPWWLRLRLGLGTSPLDLFAFPFGVQHTKLLARPYPVINPALRATVTGLTGNFLPTPAAAIMRSVRMYLLRLDGEPHASATYRGSCSRAVSRTPFRSEVNPIAQGARAPYTSDHHHAAVWRSCMSASRVCSLAQSSESLARGALRVSSGRRRRGRRVVRARVQRCHSGT